MSILRADRPSRATVLGPGESGTGKELFARLIYNLSLRGRPAADRGSIRGVLPGNALESELFGHERGSFTGRRRGASAASRRRTGDALPRRDRRADPRRPDQAC
ncbi:MAG: sigma 54-interacting transcriptional regulator [Syntrophaceae bacterium]|nr:sigma 54-interacting transcriptional regulator [Syntrophaceae bacterium]